MLPKYEALFNPDFRCWPKARFRDPPIVAPFLTASEV